jgi:hypothetical protein
MKNQTRALIFEPRWTLSQSWGTGPLSCARDCQIKRVATPGTQCPFGGRKVTEHIDSDTTEDDAEPVS